MNAKSDCAAAYAPGPSPLAVRVDSSVKALFGPAVEAAARAAAQGLGVATGTLTVEDNGALDYVVAARVEAALRAAGVAAPARHRSAAPAPAPLRERRRRSRLYLPGNQPDLFPNAGLFLADCLILDLEDSVAPSRKEDARILVRRVLEQHRGFFGEAEIIVRINPLSGPYGALDLVELSGCLPHAVILPKCESAADVAALDRALGEDTGATLIMPLVETARGVLAAAAIAAASPRVAALCFGAEDYMADVGARRSAAGTETLYARQAIVVAAKAAGVQALDSVFSDTEDLPAFASWCEASRAMGFDGVGVIHPRQVGAANAAYSPSPEEIEEARAVIAAMQEAEAGGSGVASLHGRMIDAPVARRARRIVGE